MSGTIDAGIDSDLGKSGSGTIEIGFEANQVTAADA
jgi:hypothetical protein